MKIGLPKKNERIELPLVPLKELAVFPGMVAPFFVGRSQSIKAVEAAMSNQRLVFLAPQNKTTEVPAEGDIYDVGVTAKILQMLKLPDGTVRLLTEGQKRGKILRYKRNKEYFEVQIQSIEDTLETTPALSALMDTILKSFKEYAKYHKDITPEIISSLEKIEYPDKLIDKIAPHLSVKIEKKIQLLKIEASDARLEEIAMLLESENEVLKLQNKISQRVKKRMEKSQKEYFLNEQIKQINKELGKGQEDTSGAKELIDRIRALSPSTEVMEKAEKEAARLSKLQPMSPESGVLRTYLEWIADLPWSSRSEESIRIDDAAHVLDEDHYSMKKPKERILDFIAVLELKSKQKGPILCFAGPPGTGKTSLGKSVARALKREFVRMSLGGVRDEAEIRGHRKTYVGALPGKIIQGMKKVGTVNPVFLLDEIDKINSDYRGDPASALLEVLDPEQNNSFVDHYLEVPYNLSEVFFITTANSIHTIPWALRDRMEIIEIPGYTEMEKSRIATDFLIPKQIKENGLEDSEITFRRDALQELIRLYTMESGVRNLERQIAEVIRKLARRAVKENYASPAHKEVQSDSHEEKEDASGKFRAIVTVKALRRYIGKPKFHPDIVYKEQRPGLAHGLAWTEVGGTLLPVEVAVVEGSGELILTGSLGDIMKESARTALSYLRANNRKFGIESLFQKERDIHIHVPEGAIPKDGPSAGITITAAVLSALTGQPIKAGYAMTGEITLTGRVLPIGGVKEKLLAAHRNKMSAVVLPEENRKDIEELPREVKSSVQFLFFDNLLDALLSLFEEPFITRK